MNEDANVVYYRVNTTFHSLEAVRKCVNEDSILDVLLVLSWKTATTKSTLPSWFAINRLHSFWENISMLDLVVMRGSYADVFANNYEIIVRELPNEMKGVFASKYEAIWGPRRHHPPAFESTTVVSGQALSLSPLQQQLQPILAAMSTSQSCSIQECLDFYQQYVGSALSSSAAELSRLYDEKLTCSKEIPTIVMPNQQHQRFYNNRVKEMNLHLQRLNDELNAQHENYKRVCEVLPTIFQHICSILVDGGFNKVDMLQMLSTAVGVLNSIQQCQNTQVTVCICGDTSTGKTTLVNGIVQSHCFPTADHANSACPIRISLHNDPSTALAFEVPMQFRLALENAFNSIRLAIQDLKQNSVSVEIPSGVTSPEAIRMYELCLRGSKLCLQADMDEVQICKCIGSINGLIRLVYNLKNCPRFTFRLWDVHPLQVLLDSPNILDVLPTVKAYGAEFQGMPFLGHINVVDTPGVSEHREKGSLMDYTRAILKRLFEISHRAIILTVPTATSSSSFKELRSLVRSCLNGTDKIMVAVNKFDAVIDRNAVLENELSNYRRELAKDMLPINVQVLQAKTLSDIVFGLRDINAIGGMEHVVAKLDDLSAEASSLLSRLFGTSYYVDNDRTHAQLLKASEYLSRQANFSNIIRVALQPSFQAAMEREPMSCIKQLSKCLTSVLNSLNARMASIEKRAQAMELLDAAIAKLDIFVASIPQKRAEIEASLFDQFKQTVRSHKPVLQERVAFAIFDCEVEAKEMLGLQPNCCEHEISCQLFYKRCETIAEYQTPVFFNTRSDCEAENIRLVARVNDALALSEIEVAWENSRILSLAGEMSLIARYLNELEDDILASLSTEITSDAQLMAVYAGIKSEILDCFYCGDVPQVSFCECLLSPDSQAKEVETNSIFNLLRKLVGLTVSKNQIFVPIYGVVRKYCQLLLDDHYSDESCHERVIAGRPAVEVVFKRVVGELQGLRDRLHALHVQLDEALKVEDGFALSRYGSDLTNNFAQIARLKDAIELRTSLDQVGKRLTSSAYQMDAWKARLADGADVAALLEGADSPFRELFEGFDSETYITYAEATSDFLSTCYLHNDLREHQSELNDSVLNARELARQQILDGKGHGPSSLTEDELAALKLYTMQCKFFVLINKALRNFDVHMMFALRKIMWLIKRALDKLPSSMHRNVFRGIRTDGSVLFEVGKTVVWPAFTSTSSNLARTSVYLGNPARGEVMPRIFITIYLTAGVGRCLQEVSCLSEDEVLLPPFSTFEVKSVGEVSADGRQDVYLHERAYIDPFAPTPDDGRCDILSGAFSPLSNSSRAEYGSFSGGIGSKSPSDKLLPSMHSLNASHANMSSSSPALPHVLSSSSIASSSSASLAEVDDGRQQTGSDRLSSSSSSSASSC